MLELEGHEVVVGALVQCEPPPDTLCRVTCQQRQVQTSSIPGRGRGALAESYLPRLALTLREPLDPLPTSDLMPCGFLARHLGLLPCGSWDPTLVLFLALCPQKF